MTTKRVAIAAALALAVAAATQAQAQPQITGAGATFPAPLYQKWAEAAEKAVGLKVNYQAIGSGGGINQITNRTVDFGATDANLDAKRLEDAKLLQFPTVMGSIVMAYNLPGVAPGALKLTGEIIADIYLGKITRWNDVRLVEMNRGITLPNLPIAPVYRADGSGTTFQFAGYLSLVSPEFKATVGQGTTVPWKAGTGGRGNAGVAGVVRQTRGSLGYVENAYAKQNNLAVSQLRNKAGNFITPSDEAFQAAASNADWTSDPTFGISLLDQQGPNTWPIVAPTFILLPLNPPNAETSANVMRFFDWAFGNEGDKLAHDLDYIPIPDSVADIVRNAWIQRVRGPNGQPVWNRSGS